MCTLDAFVDCFDSELVANRRTAARPECEEQAQWALSEIIRMAPLDKVNRA